MMVTDVSTAFAFEPALNPPSPFAVTAPSFGYDHDFDNLELPFLELSPTSPALSDVWRDIEDDVVDSDLFYGTCADIERLLAEMSSAANAGDDENRRFIRPQPVDTRVLRSSSLEPGRAPVADVSTRQSRRGSASDLVPGLVPVKGQHSSQDTRSESTSSVLAASTSVSSAVSTSVVTTTTSKTRRTRSSPDVVACWCLQQL